MKPFAIAPLALLAAALAGGSVHATSYNYTDHWDYIAKPALRAAKFDDRLQADAATCDSTVGAAHGAPNAGYRGCMPAWLEIPVGDPRQGAGDTVRPEFQLERQGRARPLHRS